MTIGAVISALRPDFPDITISKIRFLEAEGLITPSRTRAGYRTFSAADVNRIRYILTAQRDRFWPLKVIREALDQLDRGLDPRAGSAPRQLEPAPDPDAPAADALRPTRRLRLTSRELREAAGLDRASLDALESFGLVRADAQGHFGEPALTVARTAVALAAYGLEPRHLRAFRTAADREIGLVQQVTRPHRRRGGANGAEAEEDPTTEVMRLCLALHVALVKGGLEEG
jgi:DNA-binding transcriptional MerR regulator